MLQKKFLQGETKYMPGQVYNLLRSSSGIRNVIGWLRLNNANVPEQFRSHLQNGSGIRFNSLCPYPYQGKEEVEEFSLEDR